MSDLNWDKMKASLSEANSEHRRKIAGSIASTMRHFLLPRSRALGPAVPRCDRAQQPYGLRDRAGISSAANQAAKGHLLYTDSEPYCEGSRSEPGLSRHRGLGGFPGRPRTPLGERIALRRIMDQLEPFLKPLDPRLFDVLSAEQFRKALAAIMSEISAM